MTRFTPDPQRNLVESQLQKGELNAALQRTMSDVRRSKPVMQTLHAKPAPRRPLQIYGGSYVGTQTAQKAQTTQTAQSTQVPQTAQSAQATQSATPALSVIQNSSPAPAARASRDAIASQFVPARKAPVPGRTVELPKQPTKYELYMAKKRKHRRKGMLFIAMASTLFVFGLGVSFVGLMANRNVEAQTTSLNQTQPSAAQSVEPAAEGDEDSEVPLETKPSAADYKTYSVPVDAPKIVSVGSVKIMARIFKMGLKANGELKTPRNIHDVGWYDGSAKLGDKSGALLLDGHVAGTRAQGVFFDLKDLKAGDDITVERGDGKQYHFAVVRTQAYDRSNVDMAGAMQSAVPGKLGVNLITCYGKYDTAAKEYKQRLVVFAVQK